VTVTVEPPEVEGRVYPNGVDGRRRRWTVDEVAFEDVPHLSVGGPILVAQDGWQVTWLLDYGTGRFVLGAHRLVSEVPPVEELHPLHGTDYPTERDAQAAAYGARLVAFLVPEVERYRYGLVLAPPPDPSPEG
jgi:hypothetical protein